MQISNKEFQITFSAEAMVAIDKLQKTLSDYRLEKPQVKNIDSIKDQYAVEDQFSMDSVQATHDLDNVISDAYLYLADEAALAKFLVEFKANPQMTAAKIDALARKNLAEEHGLDLEDLNDDWNDYVAELKNKAFH